MICPHCGYDNIVGDDECARCKQDLTFLDEPSANSEVERLLMEQPVRVLKPATPISVQSKTTVRDVIRTMTDKKIGCVLVLRDADLVGIFTERDVLMKIAGRESEMGNAAVGDWMTPNPATIDFDDSIGFAIHKMDVGGYRHLPALQDGRPRGIVSVRDVIRYLAGDLAPVKQ